MTSADDGKLFQLVDHNPKGKKPRMTEEEPKNVEHKYKTHACVSFWVNIQAGKEIPLAAHVKCFTTELACLDKTISFVSFNKETSYYPINDAFPTDEEKFNIFPCSPDFKHARSP